jgi:hypothetical protein
VQALLSARIDRLAEREKQVLQTAAVIGKEFAEPILRLVLTAIGRASLSNGDLAVALETLKAREFVYETALFPIAGYAFKHPLTQEVALGSQLQERRRQVHAAVARAIEATHADKLDEHAALLAHHCAEAGEAMNAAQWHVRAGMFIGRSDFAEASRHAQRARELLGRVADDPAAPSLGANVCFRILSIGIRIGLSVDEAHQVFEEGLRWTARSGEALAAGRLYQALSVFEIGNNHIDAALTHAAEWERVACTLPDEERRACALWPSMQPLLARGDLAALRANCVQQLSWTRDHPDWGMRDWSMSAHAGALWQLANAELYDGSLDQARDLLQRGVDVAGRVGDAEIGAACLASLGDLGFFAGEADLVRGAVEHGVHISEPLSAMSRIGAHGSLGGQLLLDGQARQAVEALEYALSLCGDGKRIWEPRLRHLLAQAWLAAGDTARARALAEETLVHCLQIGARLVAIEVAVTLSAALRAESGVAAAPRIDELLTTVDRLTADTGARNLVPFVFEERAALSELRGDAREQEVHLRRAHELFTRMAATGRARQTAAALGKITSRSRQ